MRPFPRYQRLHAPPPQPPNRHPHAKSVMTRESARVQKNLNILRKKHNIWWTLWSSSSVFIIQNAVKFSQRMRKKCYHCKSFRKLRLMCSFFWKVTGSVALLFFGQMKITHDARSVIKEMPSIEKCWHWEKMWNILMFSGVNSSVWESKAKQDISAF